MTQQQPILNAANISFTHLCKPMLSRVIDQLRQLIAALH